LVRGRFLSAKRHQGEFEPAAKTWSTAQGCRSRPFPCAQEGLTNVHRRSGCSAVDVCLKTHSKFVRYPTEDLRKVWAARSQGSFVATTRKMTDDVILINFRVAGYADRGTLYNCQPLERTPTCMRSVHFAMGLWIASVRSMSMRPGSNELLHIPLTQLGTEQQGTLFVHPVA